MTLDGVRNAVRVAAVVLNVVIAAFWLLLGRHTLSDLPAEAGTQVGGLVIYGVLVGTPILSIAGLLWPSAGRSRGEPGSDTLPSAHEGNAAAAEDPSSRSTSLGAGNRDIRWG